MRQSTIARNYAEALFDLADRDGVTEAYGDAMETVARLLDEAPDVRRFLETPRVAREAKKRVLRESLEDEVPGPVLHFLFLVLDKRRQRILRSIAEEYHLLLDERLGRTHVDVTVARSLEPGELDELRGSLSALLGQEAIPHVRVRPEIVGGIIFRSGDTIFDGSIRRRLDQMRRQLLSADVSQD